MKTITFAITLTLMGLLASGCAHQFTPQSTPAFSTNSTDGSNVYTGEAQKKVKEFDGLLKLCADKRDSIGRKYNRLSKADWHWDFWTSATGLATQGTSLIISGTGGSERASQNLAFIGASVVTVLLGYKTLSKLGERLDELSYDYRSADGFINRSIDEFEVIQYSLEETDSLVLMDGLLLKLRRQSGQFLTPKGR